MIETCIDLGVLYDLLVERTWFSTDQLAFDESAKTFTMVLRDPDRQRSGLVEIQSGGVVERMRLTIHGVRKVSVREEAEIGLYDILDVRQRADILTFESNFPLEIDLTLEPDARMRIESIGPSR